MRTLTTLLAIAAASLAVVALLAANGVSGDILFGSYTPHVSSGSQSSTYLAMNDWLTTNGGPRQSVRVEEVGWGPRKNIQTVVANLADTWQWSTAVPVVSWMPYPFDTWLSPTPNDDIASGMYDIYIDQFLAAISTLLIHATTPARRMYLRFAPSPNGNWFPWSPFCPSCGATGQKINQTANSYKRMWAHVIAKVRDPKYNLTRHSVQIVFDVAATDESAPLEKFYPADGSVDWFAITGINFGSSLPGNSWQTPTQMLSRAVSRLGALNAKTPIGIMSAASTSFRRGVVAKNQWIQQLYQFAVANEKSNGIKMVSYHNADGATDTAAFGGKAGLTNWSSPVSIYSYYVYPAMRQATEKAPFVGTHTSNPQYITDAQFFGMA